MSLTKTRLKILQKIAQTAGMQGAQTTTTNSTPTTSNNTQVAPDPSSPASDYYPTLKAAFPNSWQRIDTLCRVLSKAVNVATNGKYNLQVLKDSNFTFDPSQFPSPDQKNIMVFFAKVYQTLLNRGQTFQQKTDPRQMISFLLQSSELNNLSQVNPTGQIAQQTHIQGSFKDTIVNLLNAIQPTISHQRA